MPVIADRTAWFRGGEFRCRSSGALERSGERALRIALLGPPGVGKGTQAELLSERLGACHLSTGDVFRASASLPESEWSPSLSAAIQAMRRGELVSDETVVELVRERARCLSCPMGFLLDGFPRTLDQARALDAILDDLGLELDSVISYTLPIEEIVARLSGRRTCPRCKAVYHVDSRPPLVPGICDSCGGELVQREDDQPAAILIRMAAYESVARDVSEYYAQSGRLVRVHAAGSPEAVLDRTLQGLTACRGIGAHPSARSTRSS